MSPNQALPSFNLALHPDHYKTVLPNLSFPSRPSTHIPWSGSSAPLVFSVSQTSFFLRVLPQSYFFFAFRKPRIQRLQSLALMFKLVILFLRSNSDTDVNPPSISGSHSPYVFWYLFRPWCFLWSQDVDLGEVDWRFVRVRLLIPCFLVAQLVNDHSKTQTDQAKALRRKSHKSLCHRQCLNVWTPCSSDLLFPFAKKTTTVLSLVLIWFSALSISYLKYIPLARPRSNQPTHKLILMSNILIPLVRPRSN